MPKLTILEKILVHLYTYRKYVDRYEYPVEMTQPGIAHAVGISVTHIPRNIKKLVSDGLVTLKKGHVSGKKKRVTVYFLTSLGLIRARELIERIEAQEVEVGNRYMKIGEIRKLTGLSYLEILKKIEKGEIEKDLRKSRSRVIFREIVPEMDVFVGRKRELKILSEWYENGEVMSIIAPRGMGKTSLIYHFLEEYEPGCGIIWLDIYEGRTWRSVKEIFKNLYGEDDILSILRREEILLILDGYYKVDDEFVSALNSLVKEELENSRIIVSMLSETPFYNRFYSKEDVENGRVWEINLGPLSYEEAKLLFEDIREDAFKRIYQMTKGHPRILTLLKRGRLREERGIALSPEQIHLLEYLATLKN
ncbi:ATPase [Euryarchaeota archaeon ex4484_178]|nr:ATPase [Thermoplasmata archaeon]OYT60297.1 MAG: ATPase [Euryarchaeota archaeon ex4484_178]